jgi:hypothetical protein
MNDQTTKERIIEGLKQGLVVPYVGPQGLHGVCDTVSGEPIPADSDSLILALNSGKPMAPKLMYEFPRAAMNMELKRGRNFVEKGLTGIYADRHWSASKLHTWLASLSLPYIIDTNRDQQLQEAYADRPHTLILGVARISGTAYRFKIFESSGTTYKEVGLDSVNPSLPVLFKPLGTPRPEPTYIASDADFVDYITELMGGFAIPSFVKQQRVGKRYLILGSRFTRDTERMILSELIHDADAEAGWAFIPEPTPKEERFCERQGITIIREAPQSLLS